jgi:hypothetical protein
VLAGPFDVRDTLAHISIVARQIRILAAGTPGDERYEFKNLNKKICAPENCRQEFHSCGTEITAGVLSIFPGSTLRIRHC